MLQAAVKELTEAYEISVAQNRAPETIVFRNALLDRLERFAYAIELDARDSGPNS